MMLAVVLILTAAAIRAQEKGLPPDIKNTQNPKDLPPAPQEAVKRLKLPDGFRATLFAGEPDVHQPIAMAFDDRGRMWVAECYSYPNWIPPEKASDGRDRILIFEDTDGDGTFDKRTVFMDRMCNLTGINLGFGGVWALCAPTLLFIPRDGDKDQPTGKPQVVLDGWTLQAKHNIVNGLTWGPDGWLYGRHGITAESKVGKPGTPDKERVKLNCSIWRYHPTRKIFEVVCHGTTNPWGLDFDDHGEGFFTNSVIGHLWHMVPGARYERMYGQDYNPHAYELIPSTSDHLHWGGGHWTSSRDGKGIHSDAGGGHAHSGAMIYLGDNWPDQYRHKIYMGNIHGNRINVNVLERKGCSYVGKRHPDFLTSDNPWFRPIWIHYGPDGGVYIGDWCDLGECHDYDGVHRSSGRIYKVTYGTTKPVVGLDMQKKTDAELVELQLHKNDWYVRHARRILQERAAAGKDMTAVRKLLFKMFDENKNEPRQLRALWALYAMEKKGFDAPADYMKGWLHLQLLEGVINKKHPEHLRAWLVRLYGESSGSGNEVLARIGVGARDASCLVRLYAASLLPRIPADCIKAEPRRVHDLLTRPSMLKADYGDDPVFVRLLWYGIERNLAITMAKHEGKSLESSIRRQGELLRLLNDCRISKIRQFLVRRFLESGEPLDRSSVVQIIIITKEKEALADLLQGMLDGLKGRKNLPQLPPWRPLFPKLFEHPIPEIREKARLVGLIFNDANAVVALRRTLDDTLAPATQRTNALHALISHQAPDIVPVLHKLVNDAAIRGPALRGLAAFNDEKTPPIIFDVYPKLTAPEKLDALGTLASRPKYALALLDAIDQKRIPRSDVSAFTARQLQDLKDKQVTERLAKVWGTIRTTPAEKKALITKYKNLLPPEAIAKGDAAHGRLVFNKHCAQCHMLYGEGKKIGPDLTGSGRHDLHYVLENIIDPSAVIGRDYQLTNIVTKSGRLVSGIVVEETGQAVTLQTPTERVTLGKDDVDERRLSNISMMPDNQLEQMSFNDLRDLVRYLATKEQVPLPK